MSILSKGKIMKKLIVAVSVLFLITTACSKTESKKTSDKNGMKTASASLSGD